MRHFPRLYLFSIEVSEISAGDLATITETRRDVTINWYGTDMLNLEVNIYFAPPWKARASIIHLLPCMLLP